MAREKFLSQNQLKRSDSEIQFDEDQIEKWLKEFRKKTGHSLREVLKIATGSDEPIVLRLPDEFFTSEQKMIAIIGRETYEVSIFYTYDGGHVTVGKDGIYTEYRVKSGLEIEKTSLQMTGKYNLEVDYEAREISWFFQNHRSIHIELSSFEEDSFKMAISTDYMKNFENYKEGDSFEIFEVFKDYFSEIDSIYSCIHENGTLYHNMLEIVEGQIIEYTLYNREGIYEVTKSGDKFTSIAKLEKAEVTIEDDGRMSVFLPHEMEIINIGDIFQKLKNIQKSILGKTDTEDQDTAKN